MLLDGLMTRQADVYHVRSPYVYTSVMDVMAGFDQCHWEPQIDDRRRGAFGPSSFFLGGGLLVMWRRGARPGGAGTSRVRGHAVFLLPNQGRLPALGLKYILFL